MSVVIRTILSRGTSLLITAAAAACAQVVPVLQPPIAVDAQRANSVHKSVVAIEPSLKPEEPSDTVWTIEAGAYAGFRIPLHFDAAFGARGKREHFWRLATGARSTSGIVGWKSTRYPIPIAFRHKGFSRAISPSDSVVFWSIIAQMNADFGFELFRPATVGKEDPPDVIVVDLGDMRNTDGLSRETWTPWGELFDVRVTFNDAETLHDRRVVTHEMMHALGFGHTMGWRSVLNLRQSNDADRVTPDDVAYAELAMSSRISRERENMRGLIALAVSRESSRFQNDEGYAPCDADVDNTFAGEDPMRMRRYLPVGLLTVAAACSSGSNRGPDTIAVPAAAVDTTTDRLPGATPRAESAPATGVDTPITRKIGAPAPAKK
jgi:hypothetical protein